MLSPKLSNFRFILLLSIFMGVLATALLVYVAKIHGIDATTLTGDARGYMILAENIFEHQVFSISREAPYEVESFRAPGYPFFLGLIHILSGSWLVTLYVQAFLLSLAPALLYLLARPYNERAAFWGSIIFVFEPIRLFLGASLLSDSFFVCLLLGALLVFVRAQKETQIKPALYLYGLAGLMLGACILTRPIAMFLPLLAFLCILFTKRIWQNVLLSAAVFLFGVIIVVGPWLVRNHVQFGTYSISSVGSANLMIYNAPEFLKFKPSPDKQLLLEAFRTEQNALPREEALSLSRVHVFNSTFREIIRGNELTYLGFHVFKTIPFFLTDGLRDTVRLVGIEVGPIPNITTALLRWEVSTVFEYTQKGGLAFWLLLIGSGFWFVVCLFAGVAMFKLLLERKFVLAFSVSVLIVYFALLTGPVSNARYRLPIEGLLIIAALTVIMPNRKQA